MKRKAANNGLTSKKLRLEANLKSEILADGNYVVDLAYNPVLCCAAGVLVEEAVQVYYPQQSALIADRICKCKAKEVKFHPQNPQILYWCTSDGAISSWDKRSAEVVSKYTTEKKLNTFDISESLIAAGGPGTILFWDERQGKGRSGTSHKAAINEFSDVHEDEVTQVKFHPRRSNTLTSASEDGHIAVFDLSLGTDEDNSFKSSLNIRDSAAKIGFFGERSELLWCTTFTENLYLWEWALSYDEECEGGAGPLESFINLREHLSSKAKCSDEGSFNYLLGCSWDAVTARLSLATGTSSGAVSTFPLKKDKNNKFKFGKSLESLQGGHSTVVRSYHRPSEGPFKAFTGGEDGCVVAWT